MNKEVIKLLITGVISAAAGFAAGWIIKEKLDDKMFADIAEQLDLDNAFRIEKEESAKEAIAKYKGMEVNPTVSEPIIPQKVVLTEADMAARTKEENNYTGPKIISVEDWNDEMEHDPDWDKLDYHYFPSKDFLCDWENEIRILDYAYEIGSEALDILRKLDPNKDREKDLVLYVRNPYLGCDIQITVDWDEPNAEWFDIEDLNNMEGGVKG